MLLAVYLHEDFIDVEGITVASVLSLQSPGVQGTEFDAPETDSLSGGTDKLTILRLRSGSTLLLFASNCARNGASGP